jgi:hypothetical protein
LEEVAGVGKKRAGTIEFFEEFKVCGIDGISKKKRPEAGAKEVGE